jgi:hypothetical protein
VPDRIAELVHFVLQGTKLSEQISQRGAGPETQEYVGARSEEDPNQAAYYDRHQLHGR